MDALQLKEYISANNKIADILEDLGCHKIDNKDKEWVYASFPDGDNPKGIGLNKENLSFYSFSRNIKGDIYSLISELKGIEFSEVIRYLHKLLGLKQGRFNKKKDTEIIDPLALFKKIRAKSNPIDVAELESYEEDILNDFYPAITKDWVCNEGILEPIRCRFNLGFSFKHNRIVIPHLHWETGEIVGIIGRTNNELYKELDIPKYFPIVKYEKSNNLYGLYENYFDIQKAGYVVVYESEKSVVRRCARGDNTGVALCCKSLSKVQERILKSLNVEIIIALDNDVSMKEVLEMCDRFYPLKKVSYIKDKANMLGKKDSPADANLEGFNKLFDSRYKYNEESVKLLDIIKKKGLK